MYKMNIYNKVTGKKVGHCEKKGECKQYGL